MDPLAVLSLLSVLLPAVIPTDPPDLRQPPAISAPADTSQHNAANAEPQHEGK